MRFGEVLGQAVEATPQTRPPLGDPLLRRRRLAEKHAGLSPPQPHEALCRLFDDLDLFDAVDEATVLSTDFDKKLAPKDDIQGMPKDDIQGRIAVSMARRNGMKPGVIVPAQLAILSPDVPQTLLLEEIHA